MRDLGADVRDTEIRVDLPGDVLFDFDKSDVRPAAVDTLTKLATVIRSKHTGDVRIEGHTDAKGDDAYNQALSERRAAAVSKWLVTQGGIPANVIRTQGFGRTRPVAPNTKPDGSDDPQGRQKNRRVEVIIATGSSR